MAGEIVVVTGAAQGIGRAVALRLAADGARVAVWDVDAKGGEDTARRCGDGAFWPVDVAHADKVEAAAADVKRKWGVPQGLVNNAGIFPRASALDMDLAQWEHVLRVNLTGTFLCARAIARFMLEARRGAIVNTASGRAVAG